MTTQAWNWSALDAQNEAQALVDAKAMIDRQNREHRLRLNVGQLFLAGMCSPWSGFYRCARDLYWRVHDEPETPVCPFCGGMMFDVLL